MGQSFGLEKIHISCHKAPPDPIKGDEDEDITVVQHQFQKHLKWVLEGKIENEAMSYLILKLIILEINYKNNCCLRKT